MTQPDGAPRLHLTTDGRLDDPALLGNAALRRLLDILNREGEEARVVGGAVRNGLLGLAPGDIDVATTARPDMVMARAKAARLRPIPTGIDHGTVTVLVEGTPFEVTTLREDVETDGRHAVVRFGRDFAQDAQRRDFTINALSVSADGTLHDTTGGMADLAVGRVRFIGEADRRIREDYLRVLRFFRFSATYATGALDPEGLAASACHRDALMRLSRERIRAELLKLLAARRAAAVLDAMEEIGVLPVILGASGRPDRVGRLANLESERGDRADAVLRLAALGAVTSADVRRLRDGLRLSNDEQTRLLGAVEVRSRLDPARVPDRTELRALLFSHGVQASRDGLDLAAIDAGPGGLAGWQQAHRALIDEPLPELPLGGAAVMARGIRKGPVVGAVLKRLQADWIRAGFPRDPAALAALLDAAVAAEADR